MYNFDDYPNSEIRITLDQKNDLPENAWMIRSCNWYKEELKECRRIFGRFHQYFIHGELLDCSQWAEDYQNCLNFRKTKNLNILDQVIKSEEKRIKKRLGESLRNDTWTLRNEPPKDWNKPAPQWFVEQNKFSYLENLQNEINKEKAANKNNTDGFVFTHPLVFFSGSIDERIHTHRINIINFNAKQPIHWPVIENRFKILVFLKEGENNLKFAIDGPKGEISHQIQVHYKRSRNPKRVLKIIYLTCYDLDGGTFEAGSFQTLPEQNNSIKSAQEKLQLAILMIQAFFAETLNATFQVELEESGLPKIHVMKIERTNVYLWSLKQNQLWNLVAEQLLSSPLADSHSKFLAFCSFSRYFYDKKRDKPSIRQLDHFKNIKMTKGYVALGGGGLALLGTCCLHSWPNKLRYVTKNFTDERKIDRTKLMDDSSGRGTYSGCYATTFGACTHELGHIFDLGHCPFGIMSSRYYEIDRFFLAADPEHNNWWSRSSILILVNHKWLRRSEEKERLPAFNFDGTTIRAKHGIIVIEYRDETDSISHFQEFFLPTKVITLKPCLISSILAIDTKGNIFKHELRE